MVTFNPLIGDGEFRAVFKASAANSNIEIRTVLKA
jgi:hypothetical protein